MPTLVEDLHTGAESIAKALRSSGYTTDFSPRSLWEIDRFFDEHSSDGSAKPRGLLDEDLSSPW